MARRKSFWFVAAAAALVAVACKEPLDVGNFSVTGEWKGTVARPIGTDSARYTFVFDLQQDADHVTGTATVQSGAETIDADVNGDWDYPNVTLHVTAPDFATLDYAAAFPNARPDTLRGPLTGSGFDATVLTIVRQ